MLIDTTDDVPRIREYFAMRIAEERSREPAETPISAIGVGLRLCQAGYLLLYFDRREAHDRDGEWTAEMEPETNMLELPDWCQAYESVSEEPIEVRLPDGTLRRIPAGSPDELPACAFGDAARLIVIDALARGSFGGLNLKADCQLDIDEFDGMWAWPPDTNDLGKTNLVSNLPAIRLPE